MTLVERLGLALIRPRAALALAGDRAHAGRSGSDLLVAMLVLVLATQLRVLVEAGWLAVAVDVALGVRAGVQMLTDALVIDLGFLVVAAAIIYVAGGPRRELGRAFDLACVAVLPLLFVDLIASVVVHAGGLVVPRTVMWTLTLSSYAWTGVLVALGVLEVRAAPSTPPPGQRFARTAGWALVAVVLAGIVVDTVWLARYPDRVRPMTPGDPAPAFSLPRIAGIDQPGAAFALADVAGKVVVLDFWATWCGPCLKAMPKLDAIARMHPDVAVIAINIDDASAAWQLFDERKYAMTLLAGDRETADRYGVSAIPHTVVIDRAGNVRRVFRGSTKDLEGEVNALLK